MFTGIIEAIGKITGRKQEGGNVHFSVSAPFLSEIKVDQSIAHNGVCLTVTEIHSTHYNVTAISETLKKSNLFDLQIGDRVNLERCMKIGDRLDGHIVQGHVDTRGKCIHVQEENGSWLYRFSYDSNKGLTVSKGSICINGVSLTVVDSLPGEFSVAIIPFTLHHTTFNTMKTGDKVNLEFDIVGKYVAATVAR